MRSVIVGMVAVLALGACDVWEPTGLDELDGYAETVMDRMEVAAVECEPDVVPAGELTECWGVNEDGTVLGTSEYSGLMWRSEDPEVARVYASGMVEGVSPGTATIVAEGPRESEASTTIEVEGS